MPHLEGLRATPADPLQFARKGSANQDEYGLNERCTLSVPEGTSVTVTSFSTEEFYDRLTINGESYSGPQGLVGCWAATGLERFFRDSGLL